MSTISAYTNLQDRLGREQAQVIAEFIEQAHSEDFSTLATKADLQQLRVETRADLQQFRVETRADSQELRAETKVDNQELRLYFEQKLHDLEMRLNSRMQWTAFVQILTTVAAIIGLAKFLK